MKTQKQASWLLAAFAASIMLVSSGIPDARATQSGMVHAATNNKTIPPGCSRLYAVVNSRPFTIPQGSWFWKEARSYLAEMGLPHDSYHVKQFEEAFTAVYSKIEDENLDHSAIYDMTPVFQKPGVGDVAFDYCSSS